MGSTARLPKSTQMANSANSGRERLYRPRHERNDDGRVFRARGWSSRYTAEVAIVDLLVAVVLDLHHLVADPVGRAETLQQDGTVAKSGDAERPGRIPAARRSPPGATFTRPVTGIDAVVA